MAVVASGREEAIRDEIFIVMYELIGLAAVAWRGVGLC
jgi:hypothetical protein